MMNLKLNTDPDTAGHTGAKLLAGTYPAPPKPTIKLLSDQPQDGKAGVPLFMRLPTNSCDVQGCRKYGYAFPSAQALLEHKRAIHMRQQRTPNPELRTPSASAPAPISAVGTDAKKWKCKQCEASFDSWRQLGPHVRYAHPRPKPMTPPKARKTVTVDGKYKYPCHHCDILLSTTAQLDRHLAKKHPETISQPPAPTQTSDLRPPTAQTCFLRFTGSKDECGRAAMLLIQNGYLNINLGNI